MQSARTLRCCIETLDAQNGVLHSIFFKIDFFFAGITPA
jgi:hypothetical protein